LDTFVASGDPIADFAGAFPSSGPHLTGIKFESLLFSEGKAGSQPAFRYSWGQDPMATK